MLTRRALLAPGLGLALGLALAPTSVSAAPDRQVLLVVVPGPSYEQALADPRLVALAQAGGIGLMTTSGRADDPAKTAVNLSAGRSADDAPSGPVPFQRIDGALAVDVEPYARAAGDATPGLLGSTLAASEATVAYVGAAPEPGEIALLAAMDGQGSVPVAVLGIVAGGTHEPLERALDGADVVVMPDLAQLRIVLDRTDAAELLVIVAGAGVSGSMQRAGETASPIVVARGAPDELIGAEGGVTGLTSSTTRHPGVVSDVDVAPTVLEFLGVPQPDEMVGAPIRFEGPPPTAVHERFLAYRELVGPVGVAILWLALGSLIAALGVVLLLGGRPAWLAGATALAMLASLSLFVATTPASVVPAMSYATVVGALLVVGGIVLVIAIRRGRPDPRAAIASVGVAGLALVVLDGVLGWPSQLTPLLGGGVLDGERFFGLGNAHAGIVLAGAVLGAARLRPGPGVALMACAAAFAGLPFLGADLGGAVTLAVAAALWFGLPRWRLDWRTWALTVAVALTTVALVAVADRILPGGGTHVSSVGGGPIAAAVDRLGENVRTTSANASAWLALLGLPVWLAVALARPRVFAPALEGDARWRDAVIVLAIGGVVGYLVNDTYGLAGSAFAFASGAILYPTLVPTAIDEIGVGVGVEASNLRPTDH